MNRKNITITLWCALVLLLSVPATYAADGDFGWAKAMGGANDDYGHGIVVDATGNVYTTGRFYDIVDFDPGAGAFNLTSAGSADIYVSKIDANGDFVWAKAMGGADYSASYDIALDSVNNVYTTGKFYDTADFDPSVGTFNLTSVGAYDIFVSKLDANGDFVWARAMGGMDSNASYDIAVDSAGNSYITGEFSDTVDFDPGVGIFNLTSAGNSDSFVSKLDANGDFVWASTIGGTNNDIGTGIAVDSAGNAYTTGYFSGTVDFDPGAGIFNLTTTGGYDVFVSKLDANGDFVWAKTMGGVDGDRGHCITVDVVGNVYTTGYFEGTADFDPGAGTFNLTSVGAYDIFVSKLDANGNFVWAKAMGGTAAYGIAVDMAGNVFTTGSFGGTPDFDPGVGIFNLTTSGGYDIFVSKFDAIGGFVWAKAVGGTGDDGTYKHGIALDTTGNVYITGSFQDTADFDPGSGIFNLTSAGTYDIFVLKLLALPTANTISTTASPTNATTVSFGVNFSEGVMNFEAEADLIIAETGTVVHTGVVITGGPQNYTVDITGVSGDGDMTLAVSTVSDVQDLVGNPLASSVTSTVVVIDNTPPAITIGAPSTAVTSIGPVTYLVSYSGESSSWLMPGDITLDVTGDVNATVDVTLSKATDYTVTLMDITGTGTVGFTIAANTASDAAGNMAPTASTATLVTVEPGVPIAAWPVAIVLLAIGVGMARKRRK